MTGLFEPIAPQAPLAERLRPKSLDEVVGQRHLLGEGKPLRLAFTSGKLPSMILWGPPGVGKTTLARLIANTADAEFIPLSAVLAGIKDIREAVERAEHTLQQSGRRTILFVDEVHRFNKGQQDAFLPFVESGLITFIGATTENPSFEVNSALLSRAQVFVLNALSEDELKQLLERGKQEMQLDIPLTPEVVEQVLGYADGDARRLLNFVEGLFNAALTAGVTKIDAEFLQSTMASKLRRFDKGGEAFYDQISALHKSVRGSNPDAALYWFLRMLDGGADPLYLGRRIVRMAVEDIGIADPRAQTMALEACQIYERLGSPEGELALSNAVIYLAVAAKSNAAYMAYNQAKAFVASDKSRPVPLHLRNAPTKLMKDLNYGKEYRYAHNEPGAYAAGEDYFPDGLEAIQFYVPTQRGLEGKISEKMAHLRALDEEARSKQRKK
ncbi:MULTISPECIES: replication-associated recombination protein A [Methylobacillus]|uniref:Replication-associated recombination protein A n=1 Tax=Methylobacillus flagellatus (strain ATCC 51484 / DSM 6875 / VKM B-1610 / KT) TaxID=265072 RepID=Q1H291_METFK|nr:MULTISPECIES: replication-associated recombination protein A [Methylobacillus]ABE49396.1 Recombination protein MgsA [Methylobacillus flagellatus KT]MPS48036.1 replication-associated recombination protein A [Methylobacillus sp.]